jgi:Domain of unknown function (DUF4190)/Domain of unknown function (DUF1707)
MPPDVPTPELRASDADREATAERLRTAALEGRLDATELDERMSAAYAARWCSELAQLTADVTPPPAAAPAPPAVGPPTFVKSSPPTNGLAVASLVVGCLWVWWIGSLLAVVFGHVALNQIARTGQSGRGMAIAGLVLGYIGLSTLLFAMLAVAWG